MRTCSLLFLASLPALAQISLDDRVQTLLPRKEESVWLSIPWVTNLQSARRVIRDFVPLATSTGHLADTDPEAAVWFVEMATRYIESNEEFRKYFEQYQTVQGVWFTDAVGTAYGPLQDMDPGAAMAGAHNPCGHVGVEGKLEAVLEIDEAAAKIVRCRGVADAEAWGKGSNTWAAPRGRYPLVISMIESDESTVRMAPSWYVRGDWKSVGLEQPYVDPRRPFADWQQIVEEK